MGTGFKIVPKYLPAICYVIIHYYNTDSQPTFQSSVRISASIFINGLVFGIYDRSYFIFLYDSNKP